MTVGTEPQTNSEAIPKEGSKEEGDQKIDFNEESVDVEFEFTEYTKPSPKRPVDRASVNEALTAHNKYR